MLHVQVHMSLGRSQGMLPQEKVDALRPVTGTTAPLKIGPETTSFI